MNPSGGAIGRRVVGIPDPNEYLLERILSRPNMSMAWRQVKANRGTPGVDNMPIDDFMAFARDHWEQIRSSIFAGTYKPLPVKRVEIPKATGGTRPLGIPTQSGMNNQWLKLQGLLSVKDLWVNIHYPATAR